MSVEGSREDIHSYAIQAERIRQDCEREGVRLLYVAKERNVSGGTDLANRPELLRAVEAVEAGQAEMIVAAYFDRFFRSLTVQSEVIGRVERAGGEILTLDHGRLTNGTPAARLHANLVGAVAQFFREQTAEKAAAGQAAAVAKGRLPWARVPLGYRKTADGTLEPAPEEVVLVQAAFQMRLDGASYMTIRAYLLKHGVKRSARGVDVMLHNRAYLGEIHFGSLVNLRAHPAIIDRDTFQRVARMRIPRGPQPTSTRLLARLGVLRCGSCGGRLSTMKLPRQDDYPIYRCASTNDCPRHVTISAELTERWVWEWVKAALADAEGRASTAHNATRLIAARDEAQGALDRALRSYAAAGLLEEPAAVETLSHLRAERDRAQEEVDSLPAEATWVVQVDDDMDMSARRAVIAAVVARVLVAPSGPKLPKGTARLSIEFRL